LIIMPSEGITRRGFVEAVGVSAGVASVLGAPAIGRAASANGKIRLGIIGAGSRGGQLLDSFLPQPDVELIAIADVDDRHAGETAERVKKAKGNMPDTARDYRPMLDRKDIDAVIIATPDHWHALPAIQAVMAGKDVYVEKPVAHNAAEGKAMIAAARKYNKIMAVGTQQRSSSHFQKVVEIVRSGKLGKVFWVQTWNFENISPTGMGRYPDGEAPSYVDYDRWLGPAPKRPFNPNRFHMLFRWFFDYAGGMMSDWGVHLNDIVLWALDAKGPRTVSTTGGIFTTDDDRDTPDTLQVVYEFPGTTLTYSMRKGNGLKFNGHDYGILFCVPTAACFSTGTDSRSYPTGRSFPTASGSCTATGRSARSAFSTSRPRESTARTPMSATFSTASSRVPCQPVTSRSPTAPPIPATWGTSP